MTPTRTIHLDGVATALSPIVHGGDRAGTITYLVRQPVLQPDGTIEDVPYVSGNGLRGVLRRESAELLWHVLGKPELPMPVFHALFSGGQLAKAGTGKVIDPPRLARLRTLLPHVAIFGCAGGGRIIEGKLRVGDLVPIAIETAHMLPGRLRDAATTSADDMLAIRQYTRMDTARRSTPRELGMIPTRELANATVDAAGTLLLEEPTEPVVVDDDETTQMRYGVETIAAGTRMWCSLSLTHVTDLQWAWFCQVLATWTASGAHIGGRSSVGHGRIRLELDHFAQLAPALVPGDGVARTQKDTIDEWADTNRADMLEAIQWLA